MIMIRALAAGFLVLVAPAIAGASNLFTNPVISIRPITLDFGRVPTNTTATSTFLVENIGTRTLVGKATVEAPFKIVSGANYSLRENEAQVVTVSYQPTGAPDDTQTVVFTGGGGAKATATGKTAPPRPKKPRRW